MIDTVYSDYIIYADESGDPHLGKDFDENYPVFVLVFCIFKKTDYTDFVICNLSKIKFDFWGHDAVVFHSHKIRKQKESFSLLNNKEAYEKFMERINDLIANNPFTIVATVIDKRVLKKKYDVPANPYNLGLLFCLERVTRFLEEKGQKDRITHIIVEARGAKEDAELELEFRRIMDLPNGKFAKFEIVFSDKKSNGTGLQVADLVAHPIGKFVIDPKKENKAYGIVKKKFHRYPKHEGKGLKIFP